MLCVSMDDICFQAPYVPPPSKSSPQYDPEAWFCRKRIENGHYWFVYNGEVVAEIKREYPHSHHDEFTYVEWKYRPYGGNWHYHQSTIADCEEWILHSIEHGHFFIVDDLAEERQTLAESIL